MSAAASAAERLSASASASIRAIGPLIHGNDCPAGERAARRVREGQRRIGQALPRAWERHGETVRWPSIRALALGGAEPSRQCLLHSRRTHGIRISASRTWLSTQALNAVGPDAQFRIGSVPCSCARACAMSATVWAWALHSSKRIPQSTESTGSESSETIIAVDGVAELLSRDDMSARRVPDSGQAPRQQAGSYLPVRRGGAVRRNDFSVSSRQLFPSASKCPARFPLSTEETYLGSSG